MSVHSTYSPLYPTSGLQPPVGLRASAPVLPSRPNVLSTPVDSITLTAPHAKTLYSEPPVLESSLFSLGAFPAFSNTYSNNSAARNFTNVPAENNAFTAAPFKLSESDNGLQPQSQNHHHVPYSTAKEWLDSGQIQKVEILMDPTSLSDMPVAEMKLRTGEKAKILLPRDTEDFIAELEAAQVPYAYKSTEKEGVAKVGTWAGSILKEMFGPFVLMAGTLALGSRGYKVWQNRQEDQETRAAIQKARKDLSSYPYQYQDVLNNHESNVKEALNAFLRGEQSVIVAKGLPGIGKTHVFLALAKEIAQKDPSVMTLEIRPGVGDPVRALLNEVYSGNQTQAEKAIQILNKENHGQSVKEILLYVDEVEKLAADEMTSLLVNGVHNPDASNKLPKLRMLATCNTWPSFASNSAVNSRISSILITPPNAKVTATIFTRALESELPGQTFPSDLAPALQKVFEEYPAYSARTLTQSVVKALASELKNQKQLDTQTITTTLAHKLDATPLNNTEMASLIVRTITEKIMHGHQPLDSVNGPNNLWRILQDNAEAHTAGLNFVVSLNGKQAKATIQNLLEGSSLDYSNGVTDLNAAVETVAAGLKSKRLNALRVNDPGLEQERTLMNYFKQFLEMHIQKEHEEVKDANRELEPVIEQLKTLVQKLQHMDRTSEEGQALSKAAQLYEDILTEIDPQSAAYMTPTKLEAIFRRVLNFDPLIHTAENDFGLIADPRYTSMFYHLKDMTKCLLRKV